jgi:hypothetical protein
MAAGPSTAAGTPVFVPCASGLEQIVVGERSLRRGWQAPGRIAGSPVATGSTVWSVEQAGAVDALDAATGHLRASVAIGPTTRFATPALVGERLYVPTLSGVTAVQTR